MISSGFNIDKFGNSNSAFWKSLMLLVAIISAFPATANSIKWLSDQISETVLNQNDYEIFQGHKYFSFLPK
ncbi:hypothetical protein NIES19_00640 [Anabaena cylindrica PCC 7122]|nr:hypothetical protein NIES19_00640 [Anabaena cylindrica PCC 7122]